MTQSAEVTVDGFFENVGGGGAPTAVLKAVNDGVVGTIVRQQVVDYIPFGKQDPETNKDGSIRKQLVVTLQTEHRNWENVVKIPLVDREDPSKGTVDPSEDDGTRNIYLPQWSNIQAAVADAVKKTNGGKAGPLRDGAKLGVKVINLRDTGKGNPLKEHAAMYEPPQASDGFFNEAPATQAAPSAQGSSFGGGDRGLNPEPPAQAPAAQAPPAPAAQAPAAPAQTDPWTGAAAPASGGGAPF